MYTNAIVKAFSSELFNTKTKIYIDCLVDTIAYPSVSTCLDHDLHVLKPPSFWPNQASKMGETHQFFFGFTAQEQRIPTSHNPNQKRAALWRIFSSNKSVPANRKTVFYANHDPNKQEVGLVFAWSGSELWRLFKYSRVKLKNQNPIAVDVLFKAYRMVPLSCRSNLVGRYL